jgi:hypothetical protein
MHVGTAQSTQEYIAAYESDGNEEMAQFFRDMQSVLKDYEENGDVNLNEEENTIQWFQNANALQQNDSVQRDKNSDRRDKIQVYNNRHVPMNREHIGIANTLSVPVAQDTLNPNLKNIFENTNMLFEKPLTISQISFEAKQPIEAHMLMIGDTAGLIHPLCGNGMAMAIHSAKIASEVIDDYIHQRIKTRAEMEKVYTKQWNKIFKSRLLTGKLLANILLQPKLSEFLYRMISVAPFLLTSIIKKTHGKPISIKN